MLRILHVTSFNLHNSLLEDIIIFILLHMNKQMLKEGKWPNQSAHKADK